MLGMAHNWFKKFVIKELGADGWAEVAKAAGEPEAKNWLSHKVYHDDEIGKIVGAFAAKAKLDGAEVMRRFGAFLIPEFFEMAKDLIMPEWKTLDFLENLEKAVHVPIRQQFPGATPPVLDVARTSPTQVVITYRSSRKMCPSLHSSAGAVAKMYNEKVTTKDLKCMYAGDSHCEVQVDLVTE